jgi:hypothetical protein
VGAAFVFFWRAIPDLSGVLDGTLPSIAASGLATIVVSAFTAPPMTISDPAVPS